MVNPDRNPLKDLVEIDETEMPFRSRHDPKDRPKGGRSPVGKMFVVCAVEFSDDGQPRRISMKHIPDGASKTLHGFIYDMPNRCDCRDIHLSRYCRAYRNPSGQVDAGAGRRAVIAVAGFGPCGQKIG